MKPKKSYPVIALTAIAILFAMDCTCLYASFSFSAESVQPSCHGHSEKPSDSAPQERDDCCGKCGIEMAALVEKGKDGFFSSSLTRGFYDPYVVADALAHRRGDEFIFVSLTLRDLLYQSLSSVQALPRAPPAF